MNFESSREIRFQNKLQIGGIVVAVITILVTVYFSFRSERVKDITVTYLSKRPLISTEGGRTSEGLEVRLGDSRLSAPWLFSGKIENTGNQPIEFSDIELPVTLKFSRAKIVGVEVSQKSQPALFADAAFSGKSVQLSTRLLNPGDWVMFDILFDGEPNVPPHLSARISGVSSPKYVVISEKDKPASLTLFAVPKPLMYLALVLSTLVGVSAIGMGVYFSVSFLVGCFRRLMESPHDKVSYFLRRVEERLERFPHRFVGHGSDINFEAMDNASDDKGQGERSLSALVDAVLMQLPQSLNRTLKAEIDPLLFTSHSRGFVIDQIRGILLKNEAMISSRFEIIVERIILGMALFVLGSSVTLLVGGFWRTIFQ